MIHSEVKQKIARKCEQTKTILRPQGRMIQLNLLYKYFTQ